LVSLSNHELWNEAVLNHVVVREPHHERLLPLTLRLSKVEGPDGARDSIEKAGYREAV
jgi:hypothetical protein